MCQLENYLRLPSSLGLDSWHVISFTPLSIPYSGRKRPRLSLRLSWLHSARKDSVLKSSSHLYSRSFSFWLCWAPFLPVSPPRRKLPELVAFGALVLAFTDRKLNLNVIRQASYETALITSMVFMIFIGATAFSLVFRGMEGDKLFLSIIQESNFGPGGFLLVVMIVVFIAGFFIDFIEIIFIIVPVVAPVFAAMGVDLIWLGILLAVNLQTSFLTPPLWICIVLFKRSGPTGDKNRTPLPGDHSLCGHPADLFISVDSISRISLILSRLAQMILPYLLFSHYV